MVLPTTGITTALVSQTIGQSSNDVGTLCESDKINKWSKNKPVRIQDGNCGLNITSSINLTGIINLVNTGTTWSYDKPTGGATSPFRLGDFRQYNHVAKSPILVDVPDSTLISAGSVQVYIPLISDNYSVKLSDISKIKNCYLGAYLVSANGTTGARMITATSPIISGITYVDIPIDDLLPNNYYIYPLLSDTKNTSIASIPVCNYYPLDGITKKRIAIMIDNSDLTITITANWLNDDHATHTIIYYVDITNNTDYNVTLNNCYTYVRYVNKDISDPLASGESSMIRGNITIEPYETYSINDSDLSYFEDSTSGFNIWFTSDSCPDTFAFVTDPYLQ